MRQQTTLIDKHFKHSNLKIDIETNNFLERHPIMKTMNAENETNVWKLLFAAPDCCRK
jgi:hypothetical protein